MDSLISDYFYSLEWLISDYSYSLKTSKMRHKPLRRTFNLNFYEYCIRIEAIFSIIEYFSSLLLE